MDCTNHLQSAPPAPVISLAPTLGQNLGPGAVPTTDQRKALPDEPASSPAASSSSATSIGSSTVSDVGGIISATPIANESAPVASGIGAQNWQLERGMSPVAQRAVIAVGTICKASQTSADNSLV